MTGQKRLEELTDSWYGFAIFAALASLLSGGLGILSLFFTIGSTLFTLFITFLIGRSLVKNRSSFTRMLMIVLASLFACLGVLAVFAGGAAFLANWSLSLLVQLVVAAANVYMNAKSVRVLLDRSVKVHCS
jgi:hypothetical protein